MAAIFRRVAGRNRDLARILRRGGAGVSEGGGTLSAMRVSWVQPVDLLSHELVAARDLGKDVSKVTCRWLDAGGSLGPSATGTPMAPANPQLHALADRLLDALDEQPTPP